MANRRISVYIPQTKPLTCPIDKFFIVRQTKKSRLSTYLFTQAKKSKSGDTFSSLVYYSSLSCLASKSLISFSCTSAGTSS